jgi:hypothetical protein
MRTARAIVAAAGIDVAVGYAVFLALALFPGVLAADSTMSATLAGLLGTDFAAAAGGGGRVQGTAIVLLAAATIILPWLWRNRFAPLAFAVPLLVTIAGLWPLARQHSARQEAIEALAEFGLDPAQLMREVESNGAGLLQMLGVTAWLLVAVTVYLAVRGAIRSVARPISSSAS